MHTGCAVYICDTLAAGMGEKRQLLGVTIAVIVFLSFVIFFLGQREVCESGIESVVSHENVIAVTYEKPSWLDGHIKQCEIEAYITGEYRDIKDSAEKTKEEFPDTVLLPYQFIVEVDQRVVKPYESILITDYRYTGGAHGITTYTQYNLRNGKDIPFEAYLLDIGYDEKELLQRVNQFLKDNQHDTLEELYLPFGQPKRRLPWRIQQREGGSMGIDLIFPPYSVAAYVFGTIEHSF